MGVFNKAKKQAKKDLEKHNAKQQEKQKAPNLTVLEALRIIFIDQWKCSITRIEHLVPNGAVVGNCLGDYMAVFGRKATVKINEIEKETKDEKKQVELFRDWLDVCFLSGLVCSQAELNLHEIAHIVDQHIRNLVAQKEAEAKKGE